MKKANHFIGGALLIAGTSVGAGMLAMPLMTAFAGFVPSFLLLVACWLFMLLTAYLFLEVNLAFPGEVNLVTMAGKTLGTPGRLSSWIIYLFLLYSLTTAYISASSPLFISAISAMIKQEIPSWVGPLPLLFLFAIFVYHGTKSVDYFNRVLMLGLIIAYAMLIAFIPPKIETVYLQHRDIQPLLMGLPILITSFGYHIIIPSLTTYIHHKKRTLRLMVLCGSLIPLIVYTVWQILILGAVPLSMLGKAWKESDPVTIPLIQTLQNPWIAFPAQLFSFFAVITSFLGVSLSLTDFLRDGLKLRKGGDGRLIACFLTFAPPLFFVYTYPKAFFVALQFAAAFVALLLGVLPALMTWALRKKGFFYTVWGRGLLCLVILISFAIIIVDILDHVGILKKAVQPYL